VAVIDVSFAEDQEGDGMSQWDIRIFEHVEGVRYVLHQEQIGELGVSLSRIESALAPMFLILEETDENGHSPTDSSVKAYFSCRRRP
ncbi:MAG: hypothetical protein ACLPR9_00230, partial [Acidimicrobiales bacterium]